MIPRRVRLEGFLSYREPQELVFDGAPICMLAGPNGSGKSAVFDAVTYSLFGAHRGGKQDAKELITKGREALRVEFDFEVDGATYRIVRTVKRKGTPTRQIFVHRPEVNDDRKRWQPVPDTDKKGFEGWVSDHVGLTGDAFTSSVLLRQGEAEKLLRIDPAERLKVLKQLVGIDHFERLHQRVADRAKLLAEGVEKLKRQLQSITPVEDAEIAQAESEFAAAEQGRSTAQERHDQLVRLEHQAQRAVELEAEICGLQRWFDLAGATLAEANAIERDLERLIDLRAVLPHLESVATQRRNMTDSDHAVARLETERQGLEQELKTGEAERQSVQARLDELASLLPGIEQEIDILQARLPAAMLTADRAKRCQEQAGLVANLRSKLDQYPADLDTQMVAQCEEVERLEAWRGALPALTRLGNARECLRRAQAGIESTHAALPSGSAEVTRTQDERNDRAARHQRAVATQQATERQEDRARVARDTAISERRELDQLEGRPTCDRCGQDLTPEHLELERTHRDAIVAAAEEQLRHASASVDAARGAAEAAKADLDGAQHQLDEATRKVKALQDALKDHARDAQRYIGDCGDAYGELTEPFRSRVDPGGSGDWPATTFPTPEDLGVARREVQGLTEARTRLEVIEATSHEKAKTRDQWEYAKQNFTDLAAALPEDLTAPQRDYDQLNADLDAGKKRLTELRDEQGKMSEVQKRLDQAQAGHSAALVELGRNLAGEAGRRTAYCAALELANQALPVAWRERVEADPPSIVRAAKDEVTQLEQADIEGRAVRLGEARSQAEAKRERLGEVTQLLDALPTEARRPPEEIRSQITEVKQTCDQLVKQVVTADRVLNELRERRQSRGDKEAEFLAADREQANAARLADLLGPKQLQRHLVREAEEGILRFANQLLDHLSGGLMSLRLRKTEDGDSRADKALDLEVYHRTTKDVISVAFLSGSQKFRVAVSLALGIGRYASRLRRPIESVIIDEGFGCLDREGRQVMIQELQALREHVRRIILVSHQEEFAGAFTDGYQIEMRDGTTVVMPMQG